MDTSPRFCENCGQPLFLNAKFCGTCGQPVKPLPIIQPAAPPASFDSPPPVQVEYPPAQLPQPEFFAPQQPPYAPVDYPSPEPGQPTFFAPQPPPQAGYFPPQPTQQPVYDPYQPTPSPLPPATGPAFMDEHIYGVIPGASRKRGFLGMNADKFTLVVTNQRILFATLTKEIMQQQVEQAREAAKAQGKGLLSQWGAQLTTNVGHHYYQMDPGAVLAEHPANFFYLNSQIRSIHISRYADNETYQVEYTLEMDTVAGKVKLNFSLLNEAEVKNLLTQTLGPIIR